MKMLVCCGSGIGSSFMLEMNVKKVLGELNVTSLDIEHGDLGYAKIHNADVYVATKELASKLKNLDGQIIELDNIFDINEIKTKISIVLKEKAII